MINNMGVLESTAGGAAAGTGISPGLGTVIGAGIGLVGGLAGSWSQNKANEQNIALQRETNELNAKLARENYQLQRDMLERNLLYASPMEQRRMLELAGYNPYDYVGGTGSKPVAATPSPQLPSMQSAQVQPVNSFASQLSQFGNLFADVYKTLQEGKNLQSDTIAKDIDNKTRLELNLQTLRNMGLDEEAKLLENEFNSRTIDGRVEAVDLDNLLKDATNELTKQQQLEIAIRNKFAPYRNFWEVQNLVHTGKLLYEQGKTELTKQELNRAGVRKADEEALLAIVRQNYEPKVASSEVEKNKAEGFYYNSAGTNQIAQRDKTVIERKQEQEKLKYLQRFGFMNAYQESKKIEADRYYVEENTKQITETIKNLEVERRKLYYEAEKTNLDNDWRRYHEFMNGYNSYMRVIQGAKPSLLPKSWNFE